jgi:hypothetical protein
VEPGVEDIDLPVLLDMPSPHLRAYPPETVIAEKFHAMVALGRANSRMKDYYDVWMLTSTFDLEPEHMRQAIEATFARRNTLVPAVVPDGLSDDFADDPAKQRQWTAFVRDLSGPVHGLDHIVDVLRQKLMVFSASLQPAHKDGIQRSVVRHRNARQRPTLGDRFAAGATDMDESLTASSPTAVGRA